MEKFKSKPVEVEAIQWTGNNLDAMYKAFGRVKTDLPPGTIGVFGRESFYIAAQTGDWIVLKPDLRLEVLHPKTFEQKYETR